MDGKKPFAIALTICTLLAAVAANGQGRIIYVDDDANAPGDGSSWQTAYKFLQDAVTAAESAEKPVEIRVAQGIYKPDRSAAKPQGTGTSSQTYFLLTDGMSLFGGYAGLSGSDPNARDVKLYQTILSGDLLGNDAPVTDAAAMAKDPTRRDNSLVVYARVIKTVRLDGCVITGGADSGGLWAGCDTTDPTARAIISDCTFRANSGFGWGDRELCRAVCGPWERSLPDACSLRTREMTGRCKAKVLLWTTVSLFGTTQNRWEARPMCMGALLPTACSWRIGAWRGEGHSTLSLFNHTVTN
jgi:hypothetical protein